MDIKRRINQEMVKPLYNQGINFLMSNSSPIGSVLKTALQCHTTPQCKTMSMIQGLYSWYKLPKVGFELSTDKLTIPIHRNFYLEISEALIEYANLVYNNGIEIEFYRNLIFEKWIPYTKEEFPYLVMDVNDRVKSLISELNDVIDKTLKRFICLGILEKVDELFEKDEIDEASQVLIEMSQKNADSRNKDTYGVMFVVEYYDRVRDADDPEFIRMATLKLGENCVRYFRQNNILILKIKDFITTPKLNSHYSAYQFVAIGLHTPLELQFKSLSMHRNNEDPSSPASHKTYKNKPFNNFLNNIVDEICGKPPLAPTNPSEQEIFEFEFRRDVILNSRIGITEGVPLFGVSRIQQTPNGEVPRNLEDVSPFENLELLAELYARYQ